MGNRTAPEPESIAIISGFGHHAALMAELLRNGRRTVRLVQSHPSFRVSSETSGDTTARWMRLVHDRSRWLAAGVQHRLRDRLPHSFDLDLYGSVYARLAALAARDASLAIPFSGFALPTLEAFEKRGRPCILEEAASHLANFVALQKAEHRAAGLPLDSNSIRFSPRRVSLLEREYQRAHRIHALSRYAASTLADRGVDPSKIEVIAPGVDTQRFRPPEQKSDAEKLRVLFVGRAELMKGVRALSAAMSLLRGRAVLHLAGTVSQDVRAILPSDVQLHGALTADALVNLYQQSDVLVFPSLSDGFGLVVLEAMACELPVIATTTSGGPDAIEDGVEGFLVNPSSGEAIAERLEAMLDEGRRRRMGTLSRQRVERDFSLEAYRQRLEGSLARYG